MSFKHLLLAAAACLAPLSAQAASVGVYVGYADGLRAGADFPNPFAVGETFTTGGSTYTISQFIGNLSGSPDSGAILLLNTGSTDVTINDLLVNNRATGVNYSIWSGDGVGHIGALGTVLHAGEGAIFAENNGNNFDSSDFSNAAFNGAAETGTAFDASFNNCSNGPIAASNACTSVFPIVSFTIDGTTVDFNDTAHVLDTGGFDSVNFNHIHTGGGGVPQFNNNESLNWRAIGTTGIGNPGGSVPEPGSLALIGLGLVGLAAYRRRK